MIICDREVSDDDIWRARETAKIYRVRGIQPLPSRPDRKQPLIRFADYWDKKLPEDTFDRHPTTNIQCMTGRFWGLVVIDLDGDEARQQWARMGYCPRTWITHSGGGGQHLWLRVEKTGDPIRTGFLWKGDGKHQGIERLGDKSLVMAPPSIHPETGKRYQFLARCDPRTIPMPAMCPKWVMDLPTLNTQPSVPFVPRPSSPALPSGSHLYDADAVKQAIHDKVTLARQWGLRIVNERQSSKGWIPCHAVDRADNTPSAAIHADEGIYVDRGSGVSMSFFALAVALGQFATRGDAIRFLGEQYIAG